MCAFLRALPHTMRPTACSQNTLFSHSGDILNLRLHINSFGVTVGNVIYPLIGFLGVREECANQASIKMSFFIHLLVFILTNIKT